MNLSEQHVENGRASLRAFTLVEVVMAISIAAVTCAGLLYGFVLVSRNAEWTACSLAAQAMTMQSVEMVRAAPWRSDTNGLAQTNFPTIITNLDIPMTGTNKALATNVVTITDVYTNQPLLKMVQVRCTWRFGSKSFTNTMLTYRAPDE